MFDSLTTRFRSKSAIGSAWVPATDRRSAGFCLAIWLGLAGFGAVPLAQRVVWAIDNPPLSPGDADGLPASAAGTASSPVFSHSGDPAVIAELIAGLASESYATRIRCRDRLARIGLAAFDQLREARDHPDSEVAIVARRLTSGL